MATNFFITKITVNTPGSGNDYTPLVYKTNTNGQIVFGYDCGNEIDLDSPIKIHFVTGPIPSGNSFITISTSRGQYQIYWNDGNPGEYIVLLKSLTSSNPFPYNQSSLWTGTTASQNFTLHIDMTQLGSGDGITLIATT
jgi:hypothetical protein